MGGVIRKSQMLSDKPASASQRSAATEAQPDVDLEAGHAAAAEVGKVDGDEPQHTSAAPSLPKRKGVIRKSQMLSDKPASASQRSAATEAQPDVDLEAGHAAAATPPGAHVIQVTSEGKDLLKWMAKMDGDAPQQASAAPSPLQTSVGHKPKVLSQMKRSKSTVKTVVTL